MYNYTVTAYLLSLIKDIHLSAARLNNLNMSRLVFFDLEREALNQSSFSSTSIEGNPLPLTEVRKILKTRPSTIRDTEREVIQYNDTLIWLNSEVKKKEFNFDEKLILKIHKMLMHGLLPQIKLGSFRKEPVLINDPRTRKPIFWPPDHGDIKKLTKELLVFTQSQKLKLDPLIIAGVFHKQFVIIHPFVDGNGRTVRLATKALLARLGLNTFSLFSFESYYNRNVSKYFKNVGERGDFYDLQGKTDFTEWLEYFCEGVLDELLRVEKTLNKSIPSSPAEVLSVDQSKILDFINQHGFIKDSDYAKFTARAKATRTLDFKKLIQLNMIEKHGKGPATFYKLSRKKSF